MNARILLIIAEWSPVIGAVKPWHVLILLFCLVAVAAVVGLVIWLVVRAGNKSRERAQQPGASWYPPPGGPYPGGPQQPPGYPTPHQPPGYPTPHQPPGGGTPDGGGTTSGGPTDSGSGSGSDGGGSSG